MFVCRRCGIGFDKKSTLVSHLKKQKECPTSVEDVRQSVCLAQLSAGKPKAEKGPVPPDSSSSNSSNSSEISAGPRCTVRGTRVSPKLDGAVCSYGEECMDYHFAAGAPTRQYIDLYATCVKHTDKGAGLLRLLCEKHFNSMHPENRNVRKTTPVEERHDKVQVFCRTEGWKDLLMAGLVEDFLDRFREEAPPILMSLGSAVPPLLTEADLDLFMLNVGEPIGLKRNDDGFGVYDDSHDRCHDTDTSLSRRGDIVACLRDGIYQQCTLSRMSSNTLGMREDDDGPSTAAQLRMLMAEQREFFRGEMAAVLHEMKGIRRALQGVCAPVSHVVRTSDAISINEFGFEHIGHLLDHDPAYRIRCLLSMDICRLVRNIHFDPEFPGNQNVRVTPDKSRVEVMQGSEWTEVDDDVVTSSMIQRIYNIFDNLFHTHRAAIERACRDGIEGIEGIEEIETVGEDAAVVVRSSDVNVYEDWKDALYKDTELRASLSTSILTILRRGPTI